MKNHVSTKVVYQTGLLHDLSLFEAGELTEVGERGITLRLESAVKFDTTKLIRKWQWRTKSKSSS